MMDTIKIPVSASRNYNVIMEQGALGRAGSYIMEALGAGKPVASEALGAGKSVASESSEASKSVDGKSVAGKSIDGKFAAAQGKKLCIITDATVDWLYGQPHHKLWKSLETTGFQVYKHVFPGGEQTKTMETVTEILNKLADWQFTRSDMLIALGGGITGDVTGFAAAAYLRGIEFVQIPTSLLAVVDSSVGGKTGVNLPAGKNLAGAFWQPSLVIFDPEVLNTLPVEMKLDGVAEAVKAGVIADPCILDLVCSRTTYDHYTDGDAPTTELLKDHHFLTELAARAVEVKRRIVEEDERETGKRKLLNLGHTLAHAIEKCSSYQISHGHAVAMGMDMVSSAAEKRGWTTKTCRDNIHLMLGHFGFPLDCPYTAKELAAAALQDKKRRGDTITLVIPETVDSCSLKIIDISEMESFIADGLEKGHSGLTSASTK